MSQALLPRGDVDVLLEANTEPRNRAAARKLDIESLVVRKNGEAISADITTQTVGPEYDPRCQWVCESGIGTLDRKGVGDANKDSIEKDCVAGHDMPPDVKEELLMNVPAHEQHHPLRPKVVELRQLEERLV